MRFPIFCPTQFQCRYSMDLRIYIQYLRIKSAAVFTYKYPQAKIDQISYKFNTWNIHNLFLHQVIDIVQILDL